jgi:hypothetical protein
LRRLQASDCLRTKSLLPTNARYRDQDVWEVFGPVCVSVDEAGGQEEGLLGVYLCLCDNETCVSSQGTEAKFLVPDKVDSGTGLRSTLA